MIATEEERLQIVNDVISEIQSVIHDNKWYISSDKLAELIDLPKEEFHKRLYHYRADFKYNREFMAALTKRMAMRFVQSWGKF